MSLVSKIINLFKKHFSVIILFIVSLILIYPYLREGFILGSGEIPYLIDPTNARFYYLWNDKQSLGGFSSLQSGIFFYSFFWKVLESFGTRFHPSIIFIFLSFFLPGLFFYILLDRLLGFKNRYVYLPAALLYSFNIFRISSSYTNTNLNLLFISLPLFFLFYYKMLHKKNLAYMFAIVLLSIVTSSMGGNMAVESIPYLMMALYFVYFLFVNKGKDLRWSVLSNVALVFLLFLANLFWVVPLGIFLSTRYDFLGGDLWNALSSGTFFDHFRFMGFWAFRSGYAGQDYFPYFRNYYRLPILLTTFLVSFIAFLHLFIRFDKDKVSKKIRHLRGYSILLALVSFTLVIGTKSPFGFVYNFFYNYFPLFKIYREPYAKFMPLLVFAISLSLVFSVRLIDVRLKSVYARFATVIFLSALILINVHPLFTGQALYVRRWIQGPVGVVTKIPSYWIDARSYIEENVPDERIALSPHNAYIGKFNWEYGVNVLGNIADYFIDKTFVKSWDWDEDDSDSREIVSRFYSNDFDGGTSLAEYLGPLGIRYILQENDLEWRYSEMIKPPSQMNRIIEDGGFEVVESFGKYTPDVLQRLLNEDLNPSLRNEFYYELLDEPVLILYKATDSYYVPRFYVPNKYVYSNVGAKGLADVMSLGGCDPMTYYYLNGDERDFAIEGGVLALSAEGETVIFGKPSLPNTIDTRFRDWDPAWSWPDPNNDPTEAKYGLVKIKEELELFKEKQPLGKADKLVWFGAKRIEEIRKFEVSEQVRKDLLAEFVGLNAQAMDIVKGLHSERGDHGNYWHIVEKIYKYYERGVFRLDEVSMSQDELTDAYDLYLDYINWVKGKTGSSVQNSVYHFDVPQEGTYELLIKSHGSDWEKVQDVLVSEPQEIILDPGGHLANKYPKSLEGEDFDNDSVTKFIRIPNPKSDGEYRVSFDYIVRDSEIKLTVLEDIADFSEIGNTVYEIDWEGLKEKSYPLERREVFDTELNLSQLCLNDDGNGKLTRDDQDCYSHFETLVAFSTKSINGYLLFELPAESSESSYARIENLQVLEYGEPKIVLRKTNSVKALELPKIRFKKVNPAKYAISVSGAKGPYSLVFNENFHDGWKLYLKKKEVYSENNFTNSIFEFLNGVGGASLEPATFENWGKQDIANDRHVVANGYANSWYILPEDVDGAENYELVVEFWPQRVFYVTLLILFVVGLGSVIGILYVFIKDNFFGRANG